MAIGAAVIRYRSRCVQHARYRLCRYWTGFERLHQAPARSIAKMNAHFCACERCWVYGDGLIHLLHVIAPILMATCQGDIFQQSKSASKVATDACCIQLIISVDCNFQCASSGGNVLEQWLVVHKLWHCRVLEVMASTRASLPSSGDVDTIVILLAQGMHSLLPF